MSLVYTVEMEELNGRLGKDKWGVGENDREKLLGETDGVIAAKNV